MMLITGLEVKNLERYGSSTTFCQRGSILMITAIMMPLFVLVAGMVIDLGRSLVYKAELNRACMIAAEETSKEIDLAKAQDEGRNVLKDSYATIAEKFFLLNVEETEGKNIKELEIKVIPDIENPKFISIACRASIGCFFLKIAGIDEIEINSNALGRLRRIK